MNLDFSKSLQELEGEDWGNPEDAPTNMVRRCLKLRRMPLKEFSAEDCRLLLGQNIGVPFVVPLAIEFLGQNPMEEGTIGLPCALLRKVLLQPEEFWQAHPALWWNVTEIVWQVEGLRAAIEELAPDMREFQELNVS